MIILPALNSSTSTRSATAGGDVPATGQTDLPSGASGEAETGGSTFLQQLVKNLSTLAKQNPAEKPAVSVAQRVHPGVAAKQSLNNDLNLLPGNPGMSDALRQNGSAAAGPLKSFIATRNRDKTATASDLSDSDRQALQALLAILPPPDSMQPGAPRQHNHRSDLSSTLIKNTRDNASATLTFPLSVTNPQPDDDKGAPVSAAPDQSASTVAGKSSTPSDDITFLQVLSHTGKETDKENLASGQNATLTNTVVSATSTTQTPVTTTLVAAPQLNTPPRQSGVAAGAWAAGADVQSQWSAPR